MATWRRGASKKAALEQAPQALAQGGQDLGRLARGATEAGAPQPGGAHQHHAHVRHRAQQLFDRAVAAQIFAALAIDAARGIEQQGFALAQGCGAGLDHGFHLLARAPAIAGHVRDLESARPPRQKMNAKPAGLGAVGQHARPEARPEHGHQHDGIDERRVVGEKENAATIRRGDAIQTAHADAVAQPEEAADDKAKEAG